VRELFRCPGDDHQGHYLLIHPAGQDLPALVCLHNPGIILIATYVPNVAQGRQVRVEEMIRQTVPAPVQRAVRRAIRER
jgi:hypothetical protein